MTGSKSGFWIREHMHHDNSYYGHYLDVTPLGYIYASQLIWVFTYWTQHIKIIASFVIFSDICNKSCPITPATHLGDTKFTEDDKI